MNHLETLERFGQTHCSTIDKLIWIAGALESEQLHDLLENLDWKVWEQLFPKTLTRKEWKKAVKANELVHALIHFRRLGLVAEIHCPQLSKFRFEEGKPKAWQVNRGISSIYYVYAETLEDLLTKIEERSEAHFQSEVEFQKKYQP